MLASLVRSLFDRLNDPSIVRWSPNAAKNGLYKNGPLFEIYRSYDM